MVWGLIGPLPKAPGILALFSHMSIALAVVALHLPWDILPTLALPTAWIVVVTILGLPTLVSLLVVAIYGWALFS